MDNKFVLIVDTLPKGDPLFFQRIGEHRGQGETIYVTKSTSKAEVFDTEEAAKEAQAEVERVSTHTKETLGVTPLPA